MRGIEIILAVVVVGKPGSLSGAEFKVFEDEYLNESKAFILDLNSGNLVNNPNYKKTLSEEVEVEGEVLKESVEPKVEETNTPNTAYILNEDTGQLIRNKNYNPNK